MLKIETFDIFMRHSEEICKNTMLINISKLDALTYEAIQPMVLETIEQAFRNLLKLRSEISCWTQQNLEKQVHEKELILKEQENYLNQHGNFQNKKLLPILMKIIDELEINVKSLKVKAEELTQKFLIHHQQPLDFNKNFDEALNNSRIVLDRNKDNENSCAIKDALSAINGLHLCILNAADAERFSTDSTSFTTNQHTTTTTTTSTTTNDINDNNTANSGYVSSPAVFFPQPTHNISSSGNQNDDPSSRVQMPPITPAGAEGLKSLAKKVGERVSGEKTPVMGEDMIEDEYGNEIQKALDSIGKLSLN